MIEDRDYMREPDFRPPPFQQFRRTWILIAIYAAVFIAELVGERSPEVNKFFYEKLALSKTGIANGYFWQFITYQFMHAGLMHILFNSWAIFLFGRELEPVLGARRFLALVMSSGIVGGVFQILVQVIWPALFHGGVVGASACALGLVAAYAAMFPDRQFTLMFLPIMFRAKQLFIFSAVLAATGIIFSEIFMTNVAHAAHLGGLAMGWFYVKKILPGFLLTATEGETGEEPEDPNSTKFTTREVDAILDKMSAGKKLTTEERAVLETASKKLNRK